MTKDEREPMEKRKRTMGMVILEKLKGTLANSLQIEAIDLAIVALQKDELDVKKVREVLGYIHTLPKHEKKVIDTDLMIDIADKICQQFKPKQFEREVVRELTWNLCNSFLRLYNQRVGMGIADYSEKQQAKMEKFLDELGRLGENNND